MLEKRRILTITLGYIIGIIWGLYCKKTIALFYFWLFVIYFIIKKLNRDKLRKFKLFSLKRYNRYLKIIFTKNVVKVLIIVSIFSNFIFVLEQRKYTKIYEKLDNQNIQIKAKVMEQNKDKYKIKILSGQYNGMYLYLYTKENLEYGCEIILNGKYEAPVNATNYKCFDYRMYLQTIKIAGIIKPSKITIYKNASKDIFTHIKNISDKINKKIDESNLENEEKAILQGILLGDKSNLEEEMKNNFSESNISHILAISGMHIAYIILFINLLFKPIFGKHFSKPITSFIIIIYMFLTKFPITLVRAGISGIITIMSNFVYRKNDALQTLSLSLLILLIYNPFSLFNTSLQLSFGAVMGIILFQKSFKKIIKEKLEKIENTAVRKNQKNIKIIIKVLNSKFGKIILDSSLLTFSCTISIVPILLYNFHSIPIGSLAFSILAGFIVGPIIIFGLIFSFFNFIFIESLLSFNLKLLIFISNLGSKTILNKIYLITPNFFEIVCYYISLIVFIYILKIYSEKSSSPFQKRAKNILSYAKYKARIKRKRIISVILIVCVIFSFYQCIPKNLKIYFVDVGQRRLYFNSNT